MSLSLGTLEIGLGLNTAQYDSGIKSAKDQLSSLERRVTKLGTTPLKIKVSVDDRQLYGLNSHLLLKRVDLKKTVDFYKANPIKVFAKDDALVSLNQELRELKKLSVEIKTPSKIVVEHRFSGYQDRVEKAIDRSASRLSSEIKRSYSKGGVLGVIGSILMSPFKTAGRVLDNMVTGYFEKLGQSFAEEIGVTSAKNTAKKIKSAIAKIDEQLIGKNQAYETFLSEFFRSGSIEKASQAAFPRTEVGKTTARLQKLQEIALVPASKVKERLGLIKADTELSKIFEQISQKIKQENPDIKRPELINKTVAQFLVDAQPQTQVLKGFVNSFIQEMTPLLKFIQGMRSYRTSVESQKYYNERKAGFPILKDGEDVVSVIGGAQFKAGQGGRQVAQSIELLAPNKRFIPVENPETDTDKQNPNFLEKMIRDKIAEIAPDFAAGETIDTAINAFRQVASAINPFGYSTAAAQAIANTRLAEEQGKKGSVVSYSLGGADNIQYAQTASYLGMQPRALAMAYPFLNFTQNTPKGFNAALLSGDPLGFAKLLGIGVNTNQFHSIQSDSPFGLSNHHQKHLFKEQPFLDLFYKTINADQPNMIPGQQSKVVHAGDKLYEVLGSTLQLKSLKETGGFDKTLPYHRFLQGYSSGNPNINVEGFIAKFFEGLRLISSFDKEELQPVSQALKNLMEPLIPFIAEKFRQGGANLPEDPQDFAGYQKYQQEAKSANIALREFKTGNLEQQRGWSSGNLDPDTVKKRSEKIRTETIPWFKSEESTFGKTYTKKIVEIYETIASITDEFVKTGGKLSQKTKDSIKTFDFDEFSGELADFLNIQLDTSTLPKEEEARQLQVTVSEIFLKKQSAILAYNKILDAVGKEVLPGISEIKKIGVGFEGAVALLSDDLVYKTDLDPIGATKIASENEIKAYEKLQGRLSPLLYKAVPGQALITERTQGRPLKEILDRIARPYKEIQQKIQEANKALELATDNKDATKIKELKALTKELELSARKERNRFNKAASILYQQVGQLGASLQEMGVVHNDLAAGNVFFAQGGITSIDLGNAKVDPTNSDKFNDKITTIQRAIIDSNYYGLMDPIKIIGAVESGYSKPFDTQSINSREINETLLSPVITGASIPLGSYTPTLLKQIVGDFSLPISPDKSTRISDEPLPSFFQEKLKDLAVTTKSKSEDILISRLGTPDKSGEIQHLSGDENFAELLQLTLVKEIKAASLALSEAFRDTSLDVLRLGQVVYTVMQALERPIMALPGMGLGKKALQVGGTAALGAASLHALPMGLDTAVVESMRTILSEALSAGGTQMLHAVQAQMTSVFNGLPFGIGQQLTTAVMQLVTELTNGTINVLASGGAIAGSSLAAGEGVKKLLGAATSNIPKLVSAEEQQRIEGKTQKALKAAKNKADSLITTEITPYFDEKVFPVSNPIPANIKAINPEYYTVKQLRGLARDQGIDVPASGVGAKKEEIWKALTERFNPDQLTRLLLTTKASGRTKLGKKELSGFQIPATEIPADFTKRTGIGIKNIGQEINTTKDIQSLERLYFQLEKVKEGITALRANPEFNTTGINKSLSGFLRSVDNLQTQILAKSGLESGKDYQQGLKLGLLGDSAQKIAHQNALKIVDETNKGLGNASPSWKGEKAGKNFVKGIEIGMRKEISSSDFQGLGESSGEGFQIGAVESLQDASKSVFAEIEKIKETVEREIEYLRAVATGNTAKAQTMVEQAAKKAGYGIGPVYHGTNAKFNEFDKKKIGSNTGNLGHFGEGFYSSTDKLEAKTYGDKIKSLFVRLQKPFVGSDSDFEKLQKENFDIPEKIIIGIDRNSLFKELKSFEPVAASLFEDILTKGYKQAWDDLFAKFNNTRPKSKIDLNDVETLAEWTGKSTGNSYNEEMPSYVFDILEEHGLEKNVKFTKDWEHRPSIEYLTDLGQSTSFSDSVKKMEYDGVAFGTEIVAFSPKQIKSADPITKTDKGVPVPLSARFDDSVADIRGNVQNPLVGIQKQIEQLKKTGNKPAQQLADSLLKQLENAFTNVGENSIESLINALEKGLTDLRGMGEAIGEETIEGAKKRLGIQSPSKEFEKLGEEVVRGFESGLSLGDIEKIIQSHFNTDIPGLKDLAIEAKMMGWDGKPIHGLLKDKLGRYPLSKPTVSTIKETKNDIPSFDDATPLITASLPPSVALAEARARLEQLSDFYAGHKTLFTNLRSILAQGIDPSLNQWNLRKDRFDFEKQVFKGPVSYSAINAFSNPVKGNDYYGDAEIMLNMAKIANRSTFTRGDSGAFWRNPSEIKTHPLSSFTSDQYNRRPGEVLEYIETQTTGKIDLSDFLGINLGNIEEKYSIYGQKLIEVITSSLKAGIPVFAQNIDLISSMFAVEGKQSGLHYIKGLNIGLQGDSSKKHALDVAIGIIDATNKGLGNASPSKKGKESGKNFVKGIEIGVEEQSRGLFAKISTVFSALDKIEKAEISEGFADFIKELTNRSAKRAEEIYAETIKEFKQKALSPAINLGSIPNPSAETSTGGAGGQPPRPPIGRPIASPDPEPEPNKQVKSASEMAREYLENIKKQIQLLEKQQQLLLQRKKLLSEALPKQSTRENILDDWNKKRESLFSALDKIEKAGISGGFAENFTRGIKAAIANFDGFINLLDTGGKALRTLDAKLNAATGGMINLRKGAMAMIGGFALFKGAEYLLRPLFFAIYDIPFRIQQAVTDSLLAFTELQRIKLNLNLAGVGNVEQSLDALVARADRLGISFKESAIAYSRFKIITTDSPLQAQADNIFEGFQEALAARQTNAQQQAESFRAIGQIASKSVISVEEFTQQLTESGGLNDALNVAARSIGLTTAQFYQQASAGNLLVQDVLPRLSAEYKRMSAGGLSFSTETLQSEISRFQNNIEQLQMQLGETSAVVAYPVLQGLNAVLNTLNDNLGAVVSVGAAGLLSVMGFLGKSVMQFAAAGRLGAVVSAAMGASLQVAGVASLSTATAIGRLKVAMNLATLAGIGLIKALIIPTAIIGTIQLIYSALNAGSEELKQAVKSIEESTKALDAWQNKTNSNRKGLAGSSLIDLPDMQLSGVEKFFNVLTLGSVYNYKRTNAIQGLYQDIKNIDKSLAIGVGNLKEYQDTLSNFSGNKQFSSGLQEIRNNLALVRAERTIASAKGNDQSVAKFNQREQDLMKQEQELIDKQLGPVGSRITADLQQYETALASLEQRFKDRDKTEIAYMRRKRDLVTIIGHLKKAEQDYLQVLKDQEKEYRKLQVAFNLAIRTKANANFANEENSLSRSIGLNQQFASGKINEFQFNVKVQEESLQTAKKRIATLENSANSISNTLNERLSKSANTVLSTYFKEDLEQLGVASFGEAIAENLLSPDAIQQIIDQYESDLKDNAALKDILNQAKEYATARRDILNTEKEIQQISREIIVERKKRQIQEKQASGEIVKAEQLTNLANKTSSSQNINYGLEQTKINLAALYNQLALEQEKLALNVDDPIVVKTAIANITQQIAETGLSLRDQQVRIQDYYRNLDRQIIDFNRQIEDYRRQIEDAQLSAFRENRSLSESYADLVRELDKNLLNAQNQLLDTTDRIRVQQIKNRLLIPGTSDAGKELGDIFLEFVQGQADIASRGRTFQSRTEEIETSYISTLRNIRNLQEQQQDAERNRLRTIEDIKRTQENLNRTLADLIRQTNRELGFIPQSIKDIVTNLNTLPEPIKLINSELVAISPNIKISGEDLVKSIQETAEAIRKANEQISQPSITGQFDSNLLPVPFLPKSRNGYLPPPPSQSQNNSNNSNLETNLTRLLNKHNSPLTARDFIDASQITGVSIDALVTQALIESHFGTKGRAVKTRNPLNYGNDDAGNNKFFSTFREGLIYAAQKLKEDFFFTTPEDFMSRNFRGRYGIYATDPLYGQKYRSALSNVRNELGVSQPGNAPRTQAELDALKYDGNPANSGGLNRVRQIRRNQGGQGGPEFSSPPPIAQIPTLPNQNQNNFWESDLPPVPKDNPTLPNQNQDNFWESDLPPVLKDNPINFQSPNLPPVPKLPTDNLGAAAGQIREAEIAQQDAEERLRQLEERFLRETALDRAIKFGRQQEEEARDLNRTIRDASESVTDLTINSKGYLTVQEEINKSATEVSRQYRSQIESLEDQRRTLLLNADAQQKLSDKYKEMVAEQVALGKMPADVAEQFLKNADALAERAKLAKEQVAILDQAIEQLGRNQGIATLEASFRKTRDTVRSIRDRMNDLTIQRIKLENQSRPTLFDDSAILAERISLQKEKEELEDYLQAYEGLPQYAEYVASIRSEWEKLAELRLERVALDTSPNRGAAESFFSDIREGKGIGSAFSSLGLNIATKFVEGITKPAIDALTSAIDGFTKPITQAFESVFNAIIGPVGNFFTNALNSIFKPAGNIFSSIFGGGGGGGLFNGLLSGITGIFGGGLGSLGSTIAPSLFTSAPASAFSLGTGFKLFSDGGKVGDVNAPIEKNIISAFQRERAMSGGRKPRLIVANEDELILNPKETEAYLEYRNNAPIKNYASGGFVGGKPNYSTTSNNNSSNQSLVINNTNNVTVESRNDMGYSLSQIKERENAQNERTKRRFFG